jgi:hypothetical protein
MPWGKSRSVRSDEIDAPVGQAGRRFSERVKQVLNYLTYANADRVGGSWSKESHAQSMSAE